MFRRKPEPEPEVKPKDPVTEYQYCPVVKMQRSLEKDRRCTDYTATLSNGILRICRETYFQFDMSAYKEEAVSIKLSEFESFVDDLQKLKSDYDRVKKAGGTL